MHKAGFCFSLRFLQLPAETVNISAANYMNIQRFFEAKIGKKCQTTHTALSTFPFYWRKRTFENPKLKFPLSISHALKSQSSKASFQRKGETGTPAGAISNPRSYLLHRARRAESCDESILPTISYSWNLLLLNFSQIIRLKYLSIFPPNSVIWPGIQLNTDSAFE